MSLVLGRKRLKNLEKILQWIDLPPIFIVYFSVIIYYTIFRFSYLILVYLVVSLLALIWHNGIRACLKLSLILLIFTGICMVIMKQETTDFARETKVAEVSPIFDTIQVDGDQVSFRGKSGKQIYQIYYFH